MNGGRVREKRRKRKRQETKKKKKKGRIHSYTTAYAERSFT